MKIKKGDTVFVWHVKSIRGIVFECFVGTVINFEKKSTENVIEISAVQFSDISSSRKLAQNFRLSLNVFSVSKDFRHVKEIRLRCQDLANAIKTAKKSA